MLENYVLLRLTEGLGGWTTRVPNYQRIKSFATEQKGFLNKAKEEGRRIIAVGTTSTRTLETVASRLEGEEIGSEVVRPMSGWTDIFIYPGFQFHVLDGLITNFHLPESTLIMLVSAFMGYDNTMNAYKTAVEEKYRFFSFGDSMCIL